MSDETEVDRLAAALKRIAHTDIGVGLAVEDCWQEIAVTALSEAGIELTPEQFDRAWRRLRQRALDGGPYRRDAEEMLAAARAEPTIHEIDLPLHKGKPPLTHNQRLHWRQKAQRTRTLRDTTAALARAQKIPAGARLIVQLHYAPGDMRRRDAPNLTATSKPAIDGLVDAGLVPDDHDGYVTELMPLIHPGPGKRRLWLAVTVQPDPTAPGWLNAARDSALNPDKS